jgi:hypothetical protein
MLDRKWAIMALAAAVGAAAVYGLIQLSGPSNFDDCLLAGLKGVSSDYAAKGVAIACGRKFPRPQETTAPR